MATPIRKAFLLFVLGMIGALPLAAAGSFTIDSHTNLFISPREPVPVQRAAQDLARDMQRVFGIPVAIVHKPAQSHKTTIWISDRFDLPRGVTRPSGWERLHIQAVNYSMAGSPAGHAVVLAGSDTLGTIYAIYQFSQQFLGVDPLSWWTGSQPAHRSEVHIADNFSETQCPTFRYRGFFINDEDLLTGWAPSNKAGISLKVWNRIYETILRLKGNIVCPGTWIFPNEPEIKLAGERGLMITQHHAIPLGMNVARWPKGVPYNLTKDPQILEQAWRNAVREYPPGVKVLWTVGLRGLSDQSYAAVDPSVRGNNKALGRLISKAIADQMKIVRAVHPHAHFITSLWQEGSRLVDQGDIKIPPGVRTVWADLGFGYLQDQGRVKAGEGAYYHVAMVDGRANQLSELVPASRIYSELGRYIRAGATDYLLLNTGNIRPVLMTIKAVMDLAWSGLPPGGANSSQDYYRRWSSYEFGSKAAAQITKVYEEYFNAPAHYGTPPRQYGDELYHDVARQMMLTYMVSPPLYSIPSQSPTWVHPPVYGFRINNLSSKQWLHQTTRKEIQQCGSAQPRWDAVWKKALAAESLVPAGRRPFYRAEVLAMIAVNRNSNRMLFDVSKAIDEARNGNTAKAQQSVQTALQAIGYIHRAEEAAEYGRWKHWYRGDWITNVYRTEQMLEIFSKYLANPLTHLPPPISWNGWEAYYHIMHYEGDRTVNVK